MKKIYITLILSLATFLMCAQGYEFGIVHVSDYNFKIVAIPDFDSTGNTDVSDVGFTLMLPAGSSDVTNITGVLGGKTPVVNQVDAVALTGLSLGDGTRDLFLIVLSNTPSAIFSHTSGQQIDLISFEVSNMPTTGAMTLLENSDPIAIGLGGSVDNFYNANIGSGTLDYFSGINPALSSFDFNTLSIEDPEFLGEVSIYPNPASDYIYVKSNNIIDNIVLFDVSGKQVLKTSETSVIHITHLQSGMYFLRAFKNKQSITRKIIIE